MKEIEINGRTYPCRVTMGAMLRFKRMTGGDIAQVESTDMVGLITFLYCCVASACNADGVEFGLDLDTFADSLTAEDVNRFYTEQEAGAKKKAKVKP